MRIVGTVVEAESKQPLQGLRVRGYDEDWVFDDRLGEARTDAAGCFEISYSEVQFRDLEETLPDVGSSRVDLQACKLEYSIVSPK